MGTHDIVPGSVRLETDLKVDGPPPLIQVEVCGWHSCSDRVSQLSINLSANAFKIPLGSASTIIVLQPSPRRECVTLIIPIPGDLVRLVEEERLKKGGDVEIELSVACYYLNLPSQQWAFGSAVVGPLKYTDTFTISLTAWKNALGLRDFVPLLVSRDLAGRLEELRRRRGLLTYEDVIARFIDLYEGVELERPYELLFTDPIAGIKSIKARLSDLVEGKVWSEVDVVSLYLDQSGADYLVKLRERGALVRLITRGKSDKKAHEDALKNLREKGVEVRVNNMAHCRFMIFNDEVAIITTADLDAEGLDNQRQIGVYITDRATVRQCKTFFSRLWEEAKA
jgi:hypothetical protein